MVRLVWTELSIHDLREIFDFIAADSNRYAAIAVEKIYHRSPMISANPYLGRIVPEVDEKQLEK